MKTNLINDFLQTPNGIEANRILRSCVHCGFCNATCPTYQLLGDELDGPRGRIYLIKQTLEGKIPSRQTQLHLDRCLTCRNCESTCPSGVNYSQLLNIGRAVVNGKVSRKLSQRLLQFSLRKLFLSRFIFSLLLKTGQLFKPVLPTELKQSIPNKQEKLNFKKKTHDRKILLIKGCVQPALKPQIDTAAKIIFDRLNIECIEPDATKCCGSLSHHLNAEDEAKTIIKKNINHWLNIIEQQSIEAICMTASGCGVAIKEYPQLFADDKNYADKAKKISALYKEPAEIIAIIIKTDQQALRRLTDNCHTTNQTIAFHPPCTLQHGMQHKNLIEPILEKIGFTLVPFNDSHLCCGSAGTYSMTQKKISQQLLSNKLHHINKAKPNIVATANIGCQLHLQSGTDMPVKHWLELLL
ncbi:Glycolate dehydrogenase, iron-sulfur subunit GlcF [hydrothermal vent metagenome]|uniref:Glycolate dehydrogenase, iron-sulfur subunit GlcF n=1 Tax=hydrothermal vent metagenome TaxID=652676 RepID=A0A3B0WUY0_9ZZZZ